MTTNLIDLHLHTVLAEDRRRRAERDASTYRSLRRRSHRLR